MLDKKSKILLSFLNKQPEKTFIYLEEEEYPDELGDNDDFFALVRYLDENGYVETISSSSGAQLGIRLSHKGAHWKEFRGLERRERWKERLCGFVSGVLVTVISGLILRLFAG